MCDGTQGTPDLTDQFVIGAGNNFSTGYMAGALTHDHSFTGDGHFHTMIGADNLQTGLDFGSVSDSKNITGTTDSFSSLPVYYALAWIMKL